MSEDETADGDDDWFESAVSGEASPEDAEFDESEVEVDADEDGEGDPADESEVEESEGDDVAVSERDADESPFEDEDAGAFADEMDDVAVGEEGEGPSFDDEGEGLFDDDFESAFGGGGEGDFDDEDFDSEIPRIDVGIEGLDNMIQGGIPERHLIVAIGSAGTGKTTFGLQFLEHGLSQGENCVFITLEQSKEAIMNTAEERGWEFERHEAEERLAIVDLDPIEMANSLDNIRGELPGLVESFDADRFVLDSVSLLEMMYDDQAKRRTEVYDFSRSMKKAGVTTLLTSEADEDNPYASRHGIIEYLTDAVFILQYVRSETRETRLAVEIQKIRDANHSRETKPYEITTDGISVYEQANIF